ncbi:MAG TPA: chitobiase/beta-hexosaminidase C-terminal domain-containing protein, partial [Dissulfurispiraceae bacterium]|nr:chitobiase/beta-hexosaminidase C-terminal domain-containing protein [Dissulfurispiraceae bacterium]
TYTGAQTVTLTRNEAGTTLFCTGSSTCTPSTTYSAPISISASTTLRFFSRDTAGNTETTKTASYTISAAPPATDHSGLTWTGDYKICQQCHMTEVNQVLGSVHYQWHGSAAETTSGAASQGKLVQSTAGSSALNAYCINVIGNFPGACGSCHMGLGAAPTATNAENIDCLLCHQKDYKRVKVNGVFQPDPTMTITMDQALKTLHRPVRANCLQCHAKAGGGDAVKRGDIALASATTTDRNYDVHMASTTTGNIACQQCHTFTGHKVAGRGSDIRPLDSTVAVSCSTSTCHPGKSGASGHSTAAVNRHVNRVACQTCHIPTYAKNAADTAATEATETHRTWVTAEWNATLGRYEPTPTKANNLKPVYRHWNGTSWGNNLKDPAFYDSSLGVYLISRPEGVITDTTTTTKLYPFKYKTADQPYAASLNMLIALSTATYFASGNYDQAVKDGLVLMGYPATTAYSTVKTGEFQVINHQV